VNWLLQAWAVLCDAIAADLLSPLSVFGALDLHAPAWYSDLLWKAAAPVIAASLRAQRFRKPDGPR
jgi:hypothetical protein